MAGMSKDGVHSMAVLVTGGAGYIGSHMVHRLLESGEHAVVLDNLSTGVKENLPTNSELIEGDAGDEALLSHLFQSRTFDSVIHFADLSWFPSPWRTLLIITGTTPPSAGR